MSRPSRRAKTKLPSTLSVAQYRRLAHEHDLQVSVLRYLALNARSDVYWFAIPNAGKRSWRAAATMKAEGLTPGVADLCVMLPGGRVAWLELKAAKGRPSAMQQGFAEICRRIKHRYCLVRDLPEAIDVLRKWNVLRSQREHTAHDTYLRSPFT